MACSRMSGSERRLFSISSRNASSVCRNAMACPRRVAAFAARSLLSSSRSSRMRRCNAATCRPLTSNVFTSIRRRLRSRRRSARATSRSPSVIRSAWDAASLLKSGNSSRSTLRGRGGRVVVAAPDMAAPRAALCAEDDVSRAARAAKPF